MGKGNFFTDLLKKQQRRIKRFIKNAERRGFIFDDNILPKTPKRPTQASVDRLKKLTPEQLYKKAKYITDDGKTITGTKGRELERKKSARKGAETKARNKKGAYITYEEPETPTATFDGDSYDVEVAGADDTYVYTPPKQTTTIIGNALTQFSGTNNKLDFVFKELDDWHYQANWSTYWQKVKENDKNAVQKILINAIDEYGMDVVAKRLDSEGDKVERILSSMLYGSNREQIQLDLVEYATILNGKSLSHEESTKLTTSVEQCGYEEA